MRKVLIAVALSASLSIAAAQRPMQGIMMDNCPMAGMMNSFDVKYEATETGARLVFTPKDPSKLGELQNMVQRMAERMNKDRGSMMPMHQNHDMHRPAK
jgi:hypothetical protein